MSPREVARIMRSRRILSNVVLALLLSLAPSVAHAEDRLPLDAKINNQPVRLAFDTGAEYPVLFRGAAERLGLKISKAWDKDQPLAPGKVPMDRAEECILDFGYGPQKSTFGVVDMPGGLPADIDGVISWNVFTNFVIELDAEKPGWGFLADLPTNLNGWAKWKLVPDSVYLEFECSNGKESAKIGIDTGDSGGVALGPQRWRKWSAERADKTATISADVYPLDGMVIRQVLRARKITIGGLDLVDVPVTVALSSAGVGWGHCDAVLGLHVFKQLKLLVDAKHGSLYTKPIRLSTGEYKYNRLGAVFVPIDLERTDDLIAHVVRDSPAYRAGIRDGDVLLKIGILNVTVWRTDPYILPLGRFWSQPAGTKQKLVLKRGGQQYETAVTLEELPAVD